MRFSIRGLYACLGLLLAAQVPAQGFSAQVSPPRFEESARPGSVFRNVIEITNDSGKSARFLMKTADWSLAPDGSAVFSQQLAADSCRPWVGIEAPEIQIGPNGRRRFRFEVAVPADAPSGQCRFALMIEGEPERREDGTLLVSGRIGIIVYLTIGDGAPVLSVVGTRVESVNGRDTPVLSIRNAGNAHGRLDGFLNAIDSIGTRVTLTPAGHPILPGVTRDIPLLPVGDDAETALTFPLQLKGRLESGATRLEIDSQASK